MPLPIVLGGKSVSAQCLQDPFGLPDTADDGTLLEPLELYQTLGWGVCPKGEWLVRVTCCYYDLIQSSPGTTNTSTARDCTMVEVRIQLSPLTRPLSTDYRETVHHLKLLDGAPQEDNSSSQSAMMQQPQVVVSSDRRNLAVLLFHPHQQSSALCIFQLRRPRTDLSQNLATHPISLPCYIQAKIGNDDSNAATKTKRDPPAVATHPRFVPVWGISTITCLPNTVSPSVFLAATHNGSLVWLDARSSLAVAMGHLDGLPIDDGDGDDDDDVDSDCCWLPIRSLRVAPSSEMNVGQLLLITANGKALWAHWNLESTTPVQQTLLKRASTGSVMTTEVESPCLPRTRMDGRNAPPSQSTSSSSTNKRTMPPGRNKSADLAEFFSPHNMQKLFNKGVGRTRSSSPPTRHATDAAGGGGSSPLDLKLPRIRQGDGDQQEGDTAKRRHMDEYVLKELQKKTLSTTAAITLSTVPSTSSSGPAPLLQQVQHQTLLEQRKRVDRAQRRRSQAEGAKEVDTLKRKMKVCIVDTVGGPSDDAIVVDAKFANTSTLVALLFQQTNLLKRRRVAQMFSISTLGTFQPLLTLELSNEQLEGAVPVHSHRPHHSTKARASTSTSTTNDVPPEMESGGGEGAASSLLSHQGLDYDPSSDTFAISTLIFEEQLQKNDSSRYRWFGCLWNWRSNTLGWTIQHKLLSHYKTSEGGGTITPLWSRLYFAKHPQQGNHLAFLESSSSVGCNNNNGPSPHPQEDNKQQLHVRKQVVATGMLSPPAASLCDDDGGAASACCSLEPNSILLTSDSVRFPAVSSQLSGSDTILELDWKDSTLPLNYRNQYGPPKLAVAGRHHGNSIAIASSKGVCVLDRYSSSHKKWKQFGTPSQERSFEVVAMTWWEMIVTTGSSSCAGSGRDTMEDLLVAIIQSDNGRQYLSCWSPKRLDLAHQLLEPLDYHAVINDDGTTHLSWGIPLAKGVKSFSLSLLAEPYDAITRHRRAVIAVSSSTPHSGTSDMEYSFYQLQVSRRDASINDPDDSLHEQKPYCVIIRRSCQGALKTGIRSVGPISSVFLAGASFDFDLLTAKEPPSDNAEVDIIGTLGIVRSPGGIEAVCISNTHKAYMAPVSSVDDEVSKICLADIICGSSLHSCEDIGESYPIDGFVWTIEFLNGQSCCWNVPYRLRRNDNVERLMSSFLNDAEIPRPRGLDPPTLACKKESRDTRTRYMLGFICHIGRCSDWMQQSSSGTQTDIALGLVPDSGFGCVLRSGQHTRTLHRNAIGGEFDADLFATDFHSSELFGPSEFLMMPPVFVPSLYMLLLEAAHLRTKLPSMKESKIGDSCQAEQGRLLMIERHTDFRLKEIQNKDAAMMVLRLLILRSVEMLSQVDKKHRKAQSDVSRSNLMLSLALFTEIVNVVRRCTTNLQFASLFLEVGRQIEPSFLAHLFPLPHFHSASSPNSPTGGSRRRFSDVFVHDKDHLDRFNARTVVEMFSLCIHEGSLAASASALPLLSSRMLSRSYCGLLLDRAIAAFVENIDSTKVDFDCTLEERRVIGDIFRFGIKLEDAATLEELAMAQEVQQDEQDVNLHQLHYGGHLPEETSPMPLLNDNLGTSGRSIHSTDDSDSECNDHSMITSHRSLICVGSRGSTRGSILNYVLDSMFINGEEDSEDAIRRAASCCIDAKRDLASMDFLNYRGDEAVSGTDDDSDNSYSPDLDESHASSADGTSSPHPSPSRRLLDDTVDVKSVAEVVSTVLMELVQTPKIDHPWKAIASLARLLLQQTKELPPLDTYAAAVERTSKASLEAVLPTGYHEEGQSEKVIARFLVAEIGRCEFQIESPAQEPTWVVDLVLVLLRRLLLLSTSSISSSNNSPLKELMASLVLIGLISGHVSGRAADLLEAIDQQGANEDESSKFLVNCYKATQLDAAASASNY